MLIMLVVLKFCMIKCILWMVLRRKVFGFGKILLLIVMFDLMGLLLLIFKRVEYIGLYLVMKLQILLRCCLKFVLVGMIIK
ncbi:hypothetical protein [Circoviridae sp.]|nr:hypothetical protein [Circoviridae sp.]